MKSGSCLKNKPKTEIFESDTFLKVLSDRNRLRIVLMLKSGERCVCEINKELGIPQNLTSHHLKVLRQNGFLLSRKKGVKVYYRLNRSCINKGALIFKKLLI